jgi:competence protein ComEA
MSDLPWSRGQILVGAAVLVVALALAGRFLLHTGGAERPALPRRLPVAAATTASTSTLLVVDVVGAVRRGGLQRLPQGSRVADAIARAGGATRRADLTQVNLAAPIADGEQVVVPARGSGGAASAAAPGAPVGPVHLSTATVEQLDALPGIGPVTAEKIVAYRQQHGAFHSVAELDAIPGIGPARIDQLKGLVAP